MKISEVQAFLLSFPLPQPIRLTFYGGERTVLKRDAMLIRVKVSSGLVGYAPGPGSERVYGWIRDMIWPISPGADAGRSRCAARKIRDRPRQR
jgi:hypothetical protein